MSLKSVFRIIAWSAIVLFLLGSCQNDIILKPGFYRAVLTPDTTRPSLELPFNFELILQNDQAWVVEITNAEEKIRVTEIAESSDSLVLMMPVFEGIIKAKKTKTGLIGSYTHRAAGKSWSIPFIAEYNSKIRFSDSDEKPAADVTGKWKVLVNPGSDHPEVQLAEFFQEGNHLKGTFLTLVGDYRYLEGSVSGDRFYLSCFDGAHSLVFTAKIDQGELVDGIFCGGPTWSGAWIASRNDTATLADATELTYLKSGYEGIDFSFPDLNGTPVSLSDSIFKNKAVIVQIIGSWCPNCMDETRYFSELYNQYRIKGLEIVALCYESEDFKASRASIMRFKNDIGATYTFLHAGEANKRKAAETLPMLNRIISYPTSIFIDRRGKVKKIYTGFSGPGTGTHFKALSKDMESSLEEILAL